MSPCLIPVLLTALLMTGCVVYSSPSDQDRSNQGPFSWTDCCERINVMSKIPISCVNIIAMADSPLVLNMSSIKIQPVPLQVGHRWNISFTFKNS